MAILWSWEKDDNFDSLIYNADICAGAIQWVDIKGNPVSVSREWTGNGRLGQRACLVEKAEVIGHVNELRFRDRYHFGSKISPYVYHSTGLIASNFLHSLGVSYLLYRRIFADVIVYIFAH